MTQPNKLLKSRRDLLVIDRRIRAAIKGLKSAEAVRYFQTPVVSATSIGGVAGGGSSTSDPIYPDSLTSIIDQAGGTGTPTYGTLAGLINGSNALYTVSQAKYTSGTLKVWRNGVLLAQGTGTNEWVETTPGSGTFTLGTAPKTGNWLLAEYCI